MTALEHAYAAACEHWQALETGVQNLAASFLRPEP